jgi:hypothetical protein
VNFIGCGRKETWPVLSHYPITCLEGLRKTTKTYFRIAGPRADNQTRDPRRWTVSHSIVSKGLSSMPDTKFLDGFLIQSFKFLAFSFLTKKKWLNYLWNMKYRSAK